MTFTVTGGAGFIGSNLIRELLSGGHEACVVDNLHTGSMGNLAGLPRVKVFRAHSGDIGSLPLPETDTIFHFGMPSSSPMYNKDPTLADKTAAEFGKVLEYARAKDCRLVFASTSSLYGGLPTPQHEDMDVKPFDGYTESRAAMERLAAEHSRRHGLRCIGLRFFSVYGPGEKAKGTYANVLSQFLWSMLEGRRPVIYGDGTQTRDFVFVKDVTRACTLAMESSVKCGIFNVGTGVQTSMNGAVAALNSAMGKNVKPMYVKNPVKNYVCRTQADCRKAVEALGFRAHYTVGRGIKELLTVR